MRKSIGDDPLSLALYFRRRRSNPFKFYELVFGFLEKFPEYGHSSKRRFRTPRLLIGRATFCAAFFNFPREIMRQIQLMDRSADRRSPRYISPPFVSRRFSRLIRFVRQNTEPANHNSLLLAHSW